MSSEPVDVKINFHDDIFGNLRANDFRLAYCIRTNCTNQSAFVHLKALLKTDPFKPRS